MTSTELKQEMRRHMVDSAKAYQDNYDAMSAEMLAAVNGKSTRSALDFSYEIAVVNRRFAARLRKEEVPAWSYDGFVTVPAEFADRDKLKAELNSSLEEVLLAYDAIPDEELHAEIPTSSAPTSAFKSAQFVTYHYGYHDGQLNLIQSLHGDMDIHWT